HKDSNWEQLIAADFDFNDIQTLPVIRGFSLEETVRDFSKSAGSAFNSADAIIGQFGIGADGHIAGMLPHSEAAKSTAAVFSYEAKPFTRITLTSRMFEKISAAYVFVFGENKREAITNLRTKELSIEEQPAQILKRIRESYLYSDILPM
ncbi:MAG: 6-phosphogluconolactonase, partial [Candidatus Omnitrophota bacterium]